MGTLLLIPFLIIFTNMISERITTSGRSFSDVDGMGLKIQWQVTRSVSNNNDDEYV
jgi:hypothetical protein